MFGPIRLSALVVLSSSVLFSQTILHTDFAAWSGNVSKNVVRDENGTLYALSIAYVGNSLTAPLLLQQSVDSGSTWTTVPFTFNDDGGTGGPVMSNPLMTSCSLAIDDQGGLHAVFANCCGAFYRNYHPGTGIASPIGYLGPPQAEKMYTGPMHYVNAIVVDQSNHVWIVVTSMVGGLDQRLTVSNAPYAAGGGFTDLGSISPNGGLVEKTTLVVDAAGAMHCVFESNVSVLRHRRYVPGVGWDANAATLSIGVPGGGVGFSLSNRLAADSLGGVHCLLMQNYGTTTTWQLRYQRWDPVSGWSSQTPVMDVTPLQYTNISHDCVYTLGCDEATGRVTAVYRSLATNGAVVAAEKSLSDFAFDTIAQLTPPSTGYDEYVVPTIRGALFPAFNQTGRDIDITWSRRNGLIPGTAFNDFVFVHRETSPCWIAIASPAVVGTAIALSLHSPFDPNALYALAVSAGTSPGIGIPDGRVIPLNLDPLLEFSLTPNPFLSNSIGTLSSTGTGTVGLSIPNLPGLIGTTIYTAFVTLSPASPVGITSISPARSIQFM